MRWLLMAGMVALAWGPCTAFGQGAVQQHIAKVSTEIEAEPNKTVLWLKRGRLYMEDKSWRQAEADFKHVLKLKPNHQSATFFLAQVQLETQRPKAALATVQHFIDSLDTKKKGALFRGGMLKGDVLRALDRDAEAATEYGHALNLAGNPEPSHFLAHADALTATGQADEAIIALEAGIDRLGSVVDLETRLLEILKAEDQITVAQARLEKLAESSKNPIRWRVEQGDLLLAQEQPDKAAIAYQAALELWQSLPKGRKLVPPIVALKERAEAGLARLRPATPDADGRR